MPPARLALGGSVGWAILIGGSAAIRLLAEGWETADRVAQVAMIYAAGAGLAFAPALFLGRLLSRGRWDTGFAATFLALSVLTIGLVGLVFGIQYRSYYAAWHEPALSIGWAFQFVFTTLSAFYQYLVLGLRLYLPGGLVALVAVSVWHSRSLR